MEQNRPKQSKGQTARAQNARKTPSAAEDIVWSILRNRKHGFKFKREVPYGPYRLDFYCAEAKIALEMDGEQHVSERDATRDAFLSEFGIIVFRVPNLEFFGIDRTAPYQDHIEALLKLCEMRTGRPRF